MPRPDPPATLLPFVGILLVIAGWALAHQLGSNAVFDGCASRGGAFVVLVSLGGLAIVALGGALSRGAWRRGAEKTGRSMLGQIGALFALLAGLAIVLQIAAAFIVPSCFS